MEVCEPVPGLEPRYVAVHDGLTVGEMRALEAGHLARGRAVEVFASPGGRAAAAIVVLEQLVFPGFGAGATGGGHNGRLGRSSRALAA